MQFDGAMTGQDGTSGVYCASKAGNETYGSGEIYLPLVLQVWILSNHCLENLLKLLTSFDSLVF